MSIRTFLKILGAAARQRHLLTFVCLWMAVLASSARTVPDPADATGFFTTVADKLLRSTFPFGITNIPVQSNGVCVYTPAVNRLLQLAANVRDAATTNFFPTVYRPMFYRDAQGNVFITGYQEVASVTGPNDPQLYQAISVANLPSGASSNWNAYGVPWIIGAKKNLPSFNELYSFNNLQVTRKLQVIRRLPDVGKSYNATTAADYHTNQMIAIGITNSVGYSLWNSYTTGYPDGATNYPFATPDLTIFVQNFSQVIVSNQLASFFVNNFWQNTQIDFTNWPGSQWDLTQSPNNRSASPASFIYDATNFTVLPLTSMLFDNSGNFIGYDPNGPSFDLPITVTPTFPQLTLVTTNYFLAYILDHNHVIDYVVFAGPSTSFTVSDILRDPSGPYDSANRAYMWSTNRAPSGASWGIQNQLTVSKTDTHVPAGGVWASPNILPFGLPATPSTESKLFGGFFTVTWNFNGVIYTNTALTNQAPFNPTRSVSASTIWVANDPLVHSLASDLIAYNGYTNGTGYGIYDDPANPVVAIPSITSVNDRYQPWGRNADMNGIPNVIKDDVGAGDYHASYDLALKDPLVYGSDDWNFPATNSLPLTTLGRVHRGTPWQTIYLKATNLLEYAANDSTGTFQPYGLNTWKYWSGDLDASDATLLQPISDRRLAVLLTELFNTNDATQLAPVNGTAADWENLLGGVVVLTNSTVDPSFQFPPQLDAMVMTSNSKAAVFMANALAQAKASQPGQQFASVDAILSSPKLSESSPWLNRADAYTSNDRIDYDLSDEAYEAVPSQLLVRLRPDSNGGIVRTNGGGIVQFSGGDGFEYLLQTSTNLVDWITVGTNQPSGGVMNIPLAPPRGGTSQFYRSVLLP